MSQQPAVNAPNPSEAAPTERHREKLRRVAELIGTSLLLYQRIELSLKLLSPFMVIKGQPQSSDPWQEAVNLPKSRTTLGLLLKDFTAANQVREGKRFADLLRQVALDRNELVHSLMLKHPRFATSEDACDELLIDLQERHARASPLSKVVEQILADLVKAGTGKGGEGGEGGLGRKID